MSLIKKFTLEDVRCFEGNNEFNIRPLTFLVGENSTGKSTMLGCFQTLNDAFFGSGEMDFNKKPYNMGTFSEIARKSENDQQYFSLSYELENEKQETLTCLIKLCGEKNTDEPIVQEIKLSFNDGEVVFLKDSESNKFDSSVNKNGENQFTISLPPIFWEAGFLRKFIFDDVFIRLIMPSIGIDENTKVGKDFYQFWKGKDKLLSTIGKSYTTAYSIAPIRSQPKRTYDPRKSSVTSDGSEMPQFLRDLARSKKETWTELKKELEYFGKESGLFEKIEVKEFAKDPSIPFQLKIKVRENPMANLMDVGYGISQVLPILVHIFSTKKAIMLLQQPEVHLHPSSQAALASLLTARTAKGSTFIVETHSDYMISRTRIDIMNGKIDPDNVSLIFLAPVDGNKVTVHNIQFDQQGNMLNVPAAYGTFFLKESDKLLGFSK